VQPAGAVQVGRLASADVSKAQAPPWVYVGAPSVPICTDGYAAFRACRSTAGQLRLDHP